MQVLAAKGLIPLPPSELVPLQIALTRSEDEEIAVTAAEALKSIDPKIAADVVAEGAPEPVLSYLGQHRRHPLVLEAILRRRSISSSLLIELAPTLKHDLQEVLLIRQDAIVEAPAILDALEKNEDLSPYAKRRITEYREHLLPRERRPPKTRAELEEEAEALTEEEVEDAIQEAKETPAAGEVDDLTGLTEAQIRTLSTPVRLKLSRGAAKGLRNILIRDPNPMVATSVLHNNPIGDVEIEQIANSRTVISEVLDAVAKNRSWIRKYAVVHALVKNPRSPVVVAMRLLPRLAVRDLQSLIRDRNVPHTVRTAAKKMYKMKRS
jgi:hypothetical protein